jgi:hypothetical protein
MASIPNNAAFYQGNLTDDKHVLQGCQIAEFHIGDVTLKGAKVSLY